MEKHRNLEHWESWAGQFGTDLRATTKCLSLKRLEVAALHRAISRFCTTNEPELLEIGCGNGINGLMLLELLPHAKYWGVDFSPKMIESAAQNMQSSRAEGHSLPERMAFGTLDIRELSGAALSGAPRAFEGETFRGERTQEVDIVVTDRMLINLSSAEEQLDAMRRIRTVLKPGGIFLMLENSRQTHGKLNDLREALGLPRRPAAEYNVFIDEPVVIEPFRNEMELLGVDDFGAVHDLMLYGVQAVLESGEVRYDTPLMTRLTDALLAAGGRWTGPEGSVGQNRLWIWKK